MLLFDVTPYDIKLLCCSIELRGWGLSGALASGLLVGACAAASATWARSTVGCFRSASLVALFGAGFENATADVGFPFTSNADVADAAAPCAASISAVCSLCSTGAAGSFCSSVARPFFGAASAGTAVVSPSAAISRAASDAPSPAWRFAPGRDDSEPRAEFCCTAFFRAEPERFCTEQRTRTLSTTTTQAQTRIDARFTPVSAAHARVPALPLLSPVHATARTAGRRACARKRMFGQDEEPCASALIKSSNAVFCPSRCWQNLHQHCSLEIMDEQ